MVGGSPSASNGVKLLSTFVPGYLNNFSIIHRKSGVELRVAAKLCFEKHMIRENTIVIGYLSLGVVGIACFAFAAFHAEHSLEFHVRNDDVVSLGSHGKGLSFISKLGEEKKRAFQESFFSQREGS